MRYVELASFRNTGADRNNGSYRNTLVGDIVLCYTIRRMPIEELHERDNDPLQQSAKAKGRNM